MAFDKRPILCVALVHRETGEINREPYYTRGFWVRDPADRLWYWACRHAAEIAQQTGRPVRIAYADGPVVGGFVPHEAPHRRT